MYTKKLLLVGLIVFYTTHISCAEKLVDIIIFSYDRPAQLYALLESIERFCAYQGDITVLYRTSDILYKNAYEQVKQDFPTVTYSLQGDRPTKDFKRLLMHIIINLRHDYLMFATDDDVMLNHTDLSLCVDSLQKVEAYGFYLRLGKNIQKHATVKPPIKFRTTGIPPLTFVDDTIFSWKFNAGDGYWKYPNNVDMTIYRKKDIVPLFQKLYFTSPSTLEGAWSGRVDLQKIGLCFMRSKIVNIPLNVVQEDWVGAHMNISKEYLLKQFNNGLKLSADPLYQVIPESAHMIYHFSFVPRRHP